VSPSRKTDANLQVALAGEADANRRYIAYGVQAITEGRPEIAQLFFEAAGAETVHALGHLRALGAVRSTRENLVRAATGEAEEIDVIYPRMIREAEDEGRHDAAASFRLALEREKYHREMFRQALDALDNRPPSTSLAGTPVGSPPASATSPARPGPLPAPDKGPPQPTAGEALTSALRVGAAAPPTAISVRSVPELTTEPDRIERLSSVRELVFGAQDGLVSTFAVVAGLAAAGVDHGVVFLGGAVASAAGVLSMSIGAYLSSRAQRQVYEAEIERERSEIRERPGEETAELLAALIARGMSRSDAVEVARRFVRHPRLLLETLAMFELGLAPQRLGTPFRDALVMAAAFGGGSMLPVAPFLYPRLGVALAVSAGLSTLGLFTLGVVKARLAGLSPIRSGLEVMALGVASGIIGYGLGRLASVVLGVEIG
jgi:VIT1/CCC1 family predicted Fe2+/Mn2+ transporter/rubrerythrin